MQRLWDGYGLPCEILLCADRGRSGEAGPSVEQGRVMLADVVEVDGPGPSTLGLAWLVGGDCVRTEGESGVGDGRGGHTLHRHPKLE